MEPCTTNTDGWDCEEVKFYLFCKFCEKLSKSKTRIKKMDTLERFFTTYRSEKKSFFPIMRLLLPQWDRERGAYGLREYVLAKKYIKILGLPDKDSDAQRLLNYKAPAKAGPSAGDFAQVIYEMMVVSTTTDQSDFTIQRVNQILNDIALCHANHNPSKNICFIY